MKDRKPDKPISLVEELRRRRVLYTAIVYGVSAFAITEIATFLFENFGVPDWAERLLAALFVAGFPVAMFLSWVFDIGADGIVRTPRSGRRNPRTLIAVALVLLVAATGGLFYLIFPKAPPPAVAEAPGFGYGFEPAEKLDNSVAVLPFDSLSNHPDDAFFSRGVAEEILNHLGTYRELNVIGRTSSFALEGDGLSVPRISALLGVRYLLQGSVRKYEDQVRVSTQLLNETGVQVWSRNFDRRLEDIFVIQTQIAVAVAEAVASQLNPRELDPAATRLDAYEHYLKGRDLVYARVRPQEAVDALQRAIELDPGYAPAHAELAIALALKGRSGIESAREAADNALSLRPNLLRALAARGLILYMQNPPDPASAATVLRRVLAQEPSMIDAALWLSNALALQGLEEEALEVQLRANRLDPLHPTLSRNVTNALAERGEDQRAEAIARRVIESPANVSWHPYVELFRLNVSRGRLADAALTARKWTEESARFDRLVNECYCLLIWANAYLGNTAATDYWLARSQRDFEGAYWNEWFKTVYVLRGRGRYDEALKSWEKLLDQRQGSYGLGRINGLDRLGVLRSLAGEYEAAVETLEPLLGMPEGSGLAGLEIKQALAWAYLNSGRNDRAEPLLDALEEEFEKLQDRGTLMFHENVPYAYALNTALRGENELALGRLEAIIDAGWNGYYPFHHDPRWGPLLDHPRFQSLMTKAKDDADRQRAELESSEPMATFMARLDDIISASGDGAK